MVKLETVLDLTDILDSGNIAKDIPEDELNKIGNEVVRLFEADLGSRSEWESRMEDAMRLALQITEGKTFPWEGAANVKYPLLTTAALQFSARAYGSLIQSPNLVGCRITGKDPKDVKMGMADRISKYMSWQVLEEMEDWEDDFDKMLLSLPIMGSIFKKIYPDTVRKAPISELVYSWDLVFDYWAKNVRLAPRKTHRIWLSKNKILERQREGLFVKHDFSEEEGNDGERPLADEVEGRRPVNVGKAGNPRETLEMHAFLDLDGDDYDEPYIITVDLKTHKVHRIVARFDIDSIFRNEEGVIIRIEPDEYFIQYTFIPDPNGGALGLGFGHFLTPINESINTLINQLLDAGTLSVLQSGFLGSGLRIRPGDTKIKPGEWKILRVSGMEIKNNIVPLPAKDPSNVLFMLLEMLVNSGERLSGVTDAMVGETPPANTPATTTMAMIEQGMKVFTGIYKRVYRGLTREFNAIFNQNKYLVTKEKVFAVLGTEEIMQVDYIDFASSNITVRPTADPNLATEQQKVARGQVLAQMVQLGGNPQAVLQYHMDIIDVPDKYKEALMQPVNAPPDPKVVLEQEKLALEKERFKMDQMRIMMDKERQDDELERARAEFQLKTSEMEVEIEKTRTELLLKMKEHNAAMNQTTAEIERIRAEIEKIRAETQKVRSTPATPRQSV